MPGDAWYESEEPTRLGLIAELQRIKRRTLVRPLPVILLALAITAGITYKLVTKPRQYEADITLSLTEGDTRLGLRAIPFEQLRAYVTSVLLPDAKLAALIEERNLSRLRRKLGMQWAIGELRDQLEVAIWKNSFIYYSEADGNARKSARIGLTVVDADPDHAFELVRALAAIAIETHEEQRREVALGLSSEIAAMRTTVTRRLRELSTSLAVKQAALAEARRRGELGLAAALMTAVEALAQDEVRAESQLAAIQAAPEGSPEMLLRAGLGTRIAIVEERRPDRNEQSPVVLVMILIVVGTGALIGAALFLGAFDARVHDTDDVARLDLPVLGHVPGFAGDHIGSLEERGAARGHRRGRVPSFLRWRSRH